MYQNCKNELPRKGMALWLCLTVLLFAPVVLCRAATYVVSPSGSDTNSGTAVKPFQTIAHAAQMAGAGDTVIVKPGVYRESVSLHKSGTATAPITFLAQPMGQAVISGADVVTGWQKVTGDAPIYSVPWDHVFAIDYHDGKPIEAHPEDEPLWGRAEQVIANGKQLLPTLGLEGLTQAWQEHRKAAAGGALASTVPSPLPNLGGPFSGCFAVDTAQKRLYVWLADGSDPTRHTMEAATRGQTFGDNPWENKAGVQYVQIQGFVFQYGASFPQRAVVWLHGQHNLLQNCLVEDMSGSGAAVDGTMRHCVVRDCGQTGGCAGGDGFVNEDCLWEGNCWKPINRGWDAGGVKMAVTNGGVFRRCVFRRNGGPGLWFDIDVHNVQVTQCVFQENEESGLFVEISRSNRIDHNLAVGNGIGAVGKGNDWSDGGLTLAESENCQIVDNTCVGNKDGITFREQGPRPLDTSDAGTIAYHDTGDVVTGNLCAFNQGYQLGLWYDNGFFGRHPSEMTKYPTEAAYDAYLKTVPDRVYDPTTQGLTIRHNLYWTDTKQPLILYGVPWRAKHQEFPTLAAFTTVTGFGKGSVFADPQFVNAAQGDYRVKSGSPAKKQAFGWPDVPKRIIIDPAVFLQWR